MTFTQHNDTNIYTISQEKFFRAANVNDTEIEKRKAAQRDYSWMLPLSYQTNLRDFQPQFHILNKSQSKQLLKISFLFTEAQRNMKRPCKVNKEKDVVLMLDDKFEIIFTKHSNCGRIPRGRSLVQGEHQRDRVLPRQLPRAQLGRAHPRPRP